MNRLSLFATFALLLVGCPEDEAPKPADMSASLDQFIIQPDAPPPRVFTAIRVDDETPAGQGLPLDAVEVCNPVGASCVRLELLSSSDDALDYAGVHDGPNSQDASCTAATFTRLGGTGSFARFALPEGAPIAKGSQINVWTATSDCGLVEAGDKPFSVTVVDAAGEGPVESCLGTCTISAP